jgi:hypothetical protein
MSAFIPVPLDRSYSIQQAKMVLNSNRQLPGSLEARTKSESFLERRSPDDKRQPEMATIYDDDERLLARIGYKQVTILFIPWTSTLR